MNLPKKIRIGSKTFGVEYKDSPVEVDRLKRASLLGQIDNIDSEIRLYAKGRTEEEILVCLVHEIVHGILNMMRMGELNKNEGFINTFSEFLVDTLERNKLLRSE